MKFASYLKDGQPTFGVVVGDGLVTLGNKLPHVPTLRAAIETGALAQLGEAAVDARPDIALAEAVFLPVIPNPSKTLCVGANYRDHAAEAGKTEKPWPGYFIRVDDTIVGHGQPLEAPVVSEAFDFEGELALVMGRPARHIAESEALAYVAGYTCFMDGSVRDYQKRCISAGKNFQASGASGPFLVTADEIPDPAQLTLTTYLNGDQVQHSSIAMMIHSVPKTIAYLSTIIQLRPGDVIATGTPAGVGHGREPPLWMRRGDRITVEISGVGRLSNPVA
ncbi:fumarylacetoacetate hydrolase family protein [Chelatococcus asaccharovorans]|uniref:2-keto-4-pentenoate hydratase/2-oxohepta-3-ene-1,7-dioic acid hydratase in catechol pathway n=1 Tax=Chelatococcus asaccharovorans TaxID=28210 RepID=A0A2V3UJN8_9HYPH|nr:fumarylacetoacetate hydrolase family protein [Chelatococcus asaccharovorans]MBS7706368.1 fumarylacetoacetate hydrolase family protein [Chelatococcus asaccharovorans]PXW64990.1 2-keto-4-pentenoate hydratase/2-oxohepta-3-ene-1,7-dioic acid hydratase in catechol pathway [Chelatococcus asaccharovorans]